MNKAEVVVPYPMQIAREAGKDLLTPQEFMRRKIAAEMLKGMKLTPCAAAVKVDTVLNSIEILGFFVNSADCWDYTAIANSENIPLSDEGQITEFYIPFTIDGRIVQPSASGGRKKALER